MIKLCSPPLFLHIFYTYGPLNFDLVMKPHSPPTGSIRLPIFGSLLSVAKISWSQCEKL